MHKYIRKIRYNFLLENYSFQYKITKIMGIAASFILFVTYISLSI